MTLLSRTWKLVFLLTIVGACWMGYLWLRDVSVLKVRHVEITGVESGDAPAIRRALRQTAQRMTVLHVREKDLERAVDTFPVVRSVTASVDFPSTLKVEVHRQVPVAKLTTPGGSRAVVSADGTLLPRVRSGRLPAVRIKQMPAAGTLEEAPARALVHVLGGAPSELRPLLARAYSTGHGIRIAVRQGPVLRFGGLDRTAAKWAALTRVLADPSSKGARFVDVRRPERPVAGTFTPPAPDPAASEAPAAGGEAPAAGVEAPTEPAAPAATEPAPVNGQP